MITLSMFLYPLQVSPSDFAFDSSVDPIGLIIGFGILAVLIGAVVILNAKKGGGSSKSASSTGSGSSGSGSGIFSGLKIRGIARNIGLNHEQTKMLEYVFKTDQVLDPERSINTPALLDRHFRRAYRILDQGGSSPEAQRKLAILFSVRNVLENSVIGSLTSTRQIKDDNVLVINTGKEKINVHMVSAKGDTLDVEAPKNVLGSQIKIQRGTRLNVLFFTKNNKGFSFETRVTGYSSKDGHPTMQLAHSNQLRFLSQRRFRRRQAVIQCSLYLVFVEGTGKKQRLIVDKRRLQGNIADVSVGGCSIKIMAPVQVGARFKIEFTHGDLNVAALGQILRTNRTGMNSIIHVKFLKVSQKSMNAINAFVYEYARE
ncbi:MAG: PilZ domain-containing protein [Treponema sp.]|nr:PilZ domain-containing protein [Treponema sp.]